MQIVASGIGNSSTTTTLNDAFCVAIASATPFNNLLCCHRTFAITQLTASTGPGIGATVPEPVSLSLPGFGLLSLGIARNRRASSHKLPPGPKRGASRRRFAFRVLGLNAG